MSIDKRHGSFALYYKRSVESFRWHLRKFFAVAIAGLATLLVFQFQFVHKWFPEELSKLLKLEDPSQIILLTLVLVLIERVLHIEEGLREERERKRLFRIHAERREAYAEICTLIRDRGKKLTTVDLLQFSGATALPVVKEIARTWPKAQIRLLLVPQEVADRYDELGFHWTRIRATLDELKLLTEEDSPGFDIKVWFYQTAPAISGLIIDDWLVSAGWYHELPSKSLPGKKSIRGHMTAAINALGEDAYPLLSMVRAQFNAALNSASEVAVCVDRLSVSASTAVDPSAHTGPPTQSASG